MKRILSLLAIVAMTTVFAKCLAADDSCASLVPGQHTCCGQHLQTQLCSYGTDGFCLRLYSYQTCDCDGTQVWSDGIGDPCVEIPVAVSARPDSASLRLYAPTCTGAYAPLIVGG